MFDLSQVVVDVLIDADAQDYIPVFKRHRITLQQFLDLTDVDLRSLGIALVGMRKSILSHIQRFRDCRQVKTDELQPAFSDLRLQPNSAASASGTSTSTTSTTTTTTAVRIALECCVCLDARCDTVFLTCGHVCTCRDCAIALQQCPLCRVPIAHKLPLLFTS